LSATLPRKERRGIERITMQRQSEQEQLSSIFTVFARPSGRGDPVITLAEYEKLPVSGIVKDA